MTKKIENPPTYDKTEWIFNTIIYYDKFQKSYNGVSFQQVPPSQFYWIVLLFLSVGLSFGTKNVDTFALIVMMTGFFLLSLAFLIQLKVFLFTIHDLNCSLINIKVKT